MTTFTISDISDRFGNRNNAAKKLDINRYTYYLWAKKGKIPRQWKDYIIKHAANYGVVIDKIVDEK